VLWEIFSDSNYFLQGPKVNVIALPGASFLQGPGGQNIYVFPRYSFFHKATGASGSFLWQDTLQLAKFLEAYRFLHERRPGALGSFNGMAQSIYSTTLFFTVLKGRRGLGPFVDPCRVEGAQLRGHLQRAFVFVVLQKFLRLRSSKLYFYFLRVLLREYKNKELAALRP